MFIKLFNILVLKTSRIWRVLQLIKIMWTITIFETVNHFWMMLYVYMFIVYSDAGELIARQTLSIDPLLSGFEARAQSSY